MSLTTLKVFSDTVQDIATELVAQKVDAFNAASRGGIILRPKSNPGDYADKLQYALMSGLVAERDITSSSSAATVALSRISEGSVKVARRVGPVPLEPSIYDWIGRNQGEAGAIVAQQVAKARLQDLLNTGILSFVAATLNVAGLVSDMGSTTITLAGLADAAQKMGDASSNIVCWVCHSKTWNDLYKAALSGSNTLFTYGTVNIVADPLGRPFVITDSSELYDSSDYYCLGLTAGGIVIEDNGDWDSEIVRTVGNENLTAIYQAQYTANVGIKGYQWDQSTGGRCPAAAALGTGTNWDQSVTSIKDCAGVICQAH